MKQFLIFAPLIKGDLANPVIDFLTDHVWLAFFLSSGIIFYDGYRYFTEGKKYWIHWQLLAEYVAIVWVGTSIYYHWWISLFAAIVILVAQICITIHFWSKKSQTARSGGPSNGTV
jgi:hypothetical protein